MDWSKAKTILIIAFIVTDILLGYMLFSSEKIVEPTVQQDFIEDALNLLNKKNIILATEIPKDIPYLNTLIVDYEKNSTSTLNNAFFNGDGEIQSDNENLVEIVHESESLLVLNKKKLLIYEDKNYVNKFPNLDEDEAIKIATKFIEDKKFDTSDIKLSFIKKENNTYYIEFSKLYKENYLENAFTNIQVDKRGVKKFERQWLNVKDMGETPIYTSTAPKAILGLLSMEEVYGKTIKDISLCYYFDPEKHNYLEEPKAAKQGKTDPAWRIQFEDGYKVFIGEF
ncbi:hypothetical protein KQI42_08275 [Tissierella sp. MSJ-40]|uniref:Regulatory protein YycH-like domain-containing protein n=1 Tax=Tissierella simiarum TaxID=2841534 RepID=A0ABS6E506_9FIRM|nr:hypothetical protein [Tissierella simiarum]MBU5438000.1 hypothetical protein [Tissierella simiarum]